MATHPANASPGSGSRLCELPLEILQQIAGQLADSYRPSLYALSSTSKTCHNACAFLIFHQIRLRLHTPEKLEHNVSNIVGALSRSGSIRHVHSLVLEGFLDLHKLRREWGYMINFHPLHWWNKHRVNVNEILPDEDPVHYGQVIVYDEPVINESSEEDMAWAPVASLIKMLPSLEKLVFDCPNQFPPSLLNTLHKHHPQCKLHHLTFRLRTLLWDTPYPYEMALATSPCLYRVKVIWTGRDAEYEDDFNQEAVMELVAGLAPNLKDVTIINDCGGRGYKNIHLRGQWHGLPGFVAGSVGSLTSLTLTASGGILWSMFSRYVQTWAKFTDFGSLHHLNLGGPTDEGYYLDGELLKFITQNYSFPRLKTLRVFLERGDELGPRPDHSDNFIAFFTAFGPLEELSVSGPLEPVILDAILHRHGPKLKKLTLRPSKWSSMHRAGHRRKNPMTFTKEHILQIQAFCPALEELCIPIKRTKSSAAEVEIYRTFAKLENLRFLFLILDCSEWRVKRDSTFNPPFDEEDQEQFEFGLKKGHVRNALINCAVDETLARSIWKTISKESKHLESLKLWTTGAGQFGDGLPDIGRNFYTNLSRSWLIQRIPRDDKEIINIKELGRSERETNDASRRRWDPLRPGEMEVFRRIWPSKEGSESWYDDWSSFPLEV